MLTLKVVSPQQAKNYYSKENYYSSGEQFEHSHWLGNGAKRLGLRGRIKEEDYKNLCYGKLPNGKVFRNKPTAAKQKIEKERAGVDCTFSAPKSVSLLALVKGESEIIAAHRKAVEKTLALIEKRYAATRVLKGGIRAPVHTENLVIATYHHDTSRELDPHLHTHCVVMNLTQLPSGKWQSLYNNPFFANRRLLDQIYQNSLAIELKQLGYSVERQEHGGYEVEGFFEEHIEYFSKRRQQILEEVPDIKNSTWAEREKAWAASRIKKGEPIPREELMAYWTDEALNLGLEFPSPNKNLDRQQRHEKSTEALLEEAIAHCSERSVSFKREDLEGFILSNSIGHKFSDIEASLDRSDELLYLNDSQYTTQAAINREIATIRLMKEGQKRVKPITNNVEIEEYLKGKSLTDGQFEAIMLSATTKDRFIAWQGDAGVGKTYALRQFKDTLNHFETIAKAKGYSIKGFAPSAAAAKVLGDSLEIETNTVASKLVSKETPTIDNNQIWIVDEAGLLSADSALDLLSRAVKENARVILVGDTKQLSAVEAGNPFKSLQNHGLKTAHLTESLRQKVPDLQHSVKLAARGEITASISHLDNNGRIKYEPIDSQQIEKIIKDYLALSEDERERTLVLAGTNANRAIITDGIRKNLKKSGYLGESSAVTNLVPKDLTDVEKKYAHNLAVGELIVPVFGSRDRGLEKGKLYEIVSKSRDKVEVRVESGQILEIDLDFSKVVYQRRQLEIASGDRLKWKKNNKSLNRRNGQEFSIAQIDGKEAIIQYTNGSTETIDLSLPQYLDYNWVSTTYSSQGKTKNNVLMLADNLDKESFYVGVSRCKYGLTVYATDKQDLIKKANKSRSSKTALEAAIPSVVKTPTSTPTPTPTPTPTNKPIKTPIKTPIEPTKPKQIDIPIKTPIEPTKPKQIDSPTPAPIIKPTPTPTSTPINTPIDKPISTPQPKQIDIPIEPPIDSQKPKQINSPTPAPTNTPIIKPIDKLYSTPNPINKPIDTPLTKGVLVTKQTRQGWVSGKIVKLSSSNNYRYIWVDWGNGLALLENPKLLTKFEQNHERKQLQPPERRSKPATTGQPRKDHDVSNFQGGYNSNRAPDSQDRADGNPDPEARPRIRANVERLNKSSQKHGQSHGLKLGVCDWYGRTERQYEEAGRNYQLNSDRYREASGNYELSKQSYREANRRYQRANDRYLDANQRYRQANNRLTKSSELWTQQQYERLRAIYDRIAAAVCQDRAYSGTTLDLAIAIQLMRDRSETEIKQILAASPQLPELKQNLDPETYEFEKQKYIDEIYQKATIKRENIILDLKKTISRWLDMYGTKESNDVVTYRDDDWCLVRNKNSISIIRNSNNTEVFKANGEVIINYELNNLEISKLIDMRQKLEELEQRKTYTQKRRSYEIER